MPEMSLSEWYKSGGHLPPETSDPIPDAPSFGMRDIFAMSGMPRDKADALANQYKPAVKMKDGGLAQSYTTLTARGEAQRRGLRPQDFGGSDWNYQTLSNALNANIISGQSRRNPRILATPASTQPAPTQESVLGDINKYGIDFTARFGNETNVGGYNNTGLTQKGYNVAQTGFNDRLANLEKAALAQGISPADFQTNLNKSLQSGQEFYKEADRRFQKEDNRGGVLGFLDKATPIITKVGAMYIGGGMLESPFASTMAMPGTNIPLNTVTQGADTALKIYNEMGKKPTTFAEGGLAGGGKTRAGTRAEPFPWEEAAKEQYQRTKARLKGLVADPSQELRNISRQYFYDPTLSPEENEQKLDDLAMGFAGTTIGKVPRMSKAQSIEAGLYHPVGRGKKLARPVNEVEFTRVPDPNMPIAPKKIITPEDLLDKQGYPVTWDPSAAGELLTGMRGKLFEEPVVLQGGEGYQRTHGGLQSPQKLAVASHPGVIKRHSNIIKRIASEGDEPVSVVLAMSPGHSLDYNKMIAQTLMQEIKNSKISSKLAKEFDEEVRKQFPDFVGIKNKKLDKQLNSDTSGNLRKYVADRMLLDQFQKGGFPDAIEARVAISNPDMLNADLGSGGSSFGLMDPAGGVILDPLNPHNTYLAASPGTYLGGMKPRFSTEEFFPTFYEQRRLLSADPTNDWYTFGRTIPTQKFDQEWLDKIMPLYEQRMKQMTGKKEGGLVEMAEGGQAFPLKDDFAAEMERRRNRPRTRAGVPVEDTNVLGGALSGLGEMFQGAARGYGATMLGGPADILNLVDIPKVMTGESYQIPYGSEYFKEKLPFAPTTQTGKVAQELGGLVPLDPSKLVKSGVTGAKKVGQYLSPEIANLLETQLQKSGMMMSMAPEGKAAKVKAPANDLGFYSTVEKAALNLQRKSGTGDSFLADLMKNPGVSESRLEEMGLTALRGKKNVTADEVRALASENKVPLTESKKIERNETAIEELESEYEDLNRQFNDLAGSGNTSAINRLSAEIDNNIQNQKRLKSMPEAKFGPLNQPDYNMPGGENYREIRVKLPTKRLTEDEARKVLGAGPNAKLSEADITFASNKNKDQFFNEAHHGNEPDVLFHLRVAEYGDAEGKRGLLIDELQSDWHQAGRDKGYKIELTPEEKKEIKDLLGKKLTPEGQSTADVQRMRELEAKRSGVPDVPFKDNWYQLGLKRAIKEATDSGMDRVYLTTGKTQADRYNLSKQIGYLSIKPKPNGMVSIRASKDGEQIILKEIPKDQLADYVGKDMAKKAIDDIDAGKPAQYSDLDLKIGGEGMKQYYDKTYLNWLKKYAKEHNAEVGMTKLSGSDDPVYFLDLTPKLKETAKKGQSYKTGGSVNKPAQTLSEWYLSGGHLPR